MQRVGSAACVGHAGCPGLADPAVVGRPSRIGGASLAFTAPLDQLLYRDRSQRVGLAGRCRATALGLPLPQAPGIRHLGFRFGPAHACASSPRAESRPRRHDVARHRRAAWAACLLRRRCRVRSARARAVAPGRSTRLPASLADVDWTGLHDIPTVLVTGSNGKTTTVRLLAAMFDAAGLRAGFNCTDGVFVDGEQVERGDYSGPAGARQVLRDRRVQAAVLETARGGILRRGLAVHHANAGDRNQCQPRSFRRVRRARSGRTCGCQAGAGPGDCAMTACWCSTPMTPLLLDKSVGLVCPLAWFSLDHMNPRLQAHPRGGRHDLRRARVARCCCTCTRQTHCLGAVADDAADASQVPRATTSPTSPAPPWSRRGWALTRMSSPGSWPVSVTVVSTTRAGWSAGASAVRTFCSTMRTTPTACAACWPSPR